MAGPCSRQPRDKFTRLRNHADAALGKGRNVKSLLYVGAVLGLVLGMAGITQAGTILIVTDTQAEEASLAAFLGTLGHTVTVSNGQQYRNGNEGAAGAAAYVAANGVDLVVISRVTSSGDYSQFAWNSINVPMLSMSPHLARNNRWKWIDTADATANQAWTQINILQPTHPFMAGLTTGVIADFSAFGDELSYNNTTNAGNGVLVATKGDGLNLGAVSVIGWAAGVEFYPGSGQTPAARRALIPSIPYHEDLNDFTNFTAEGRLLIANTVNNMIPEPATLTLLGLGVAATLFRRRK